MKHEGMGDILPVNWMFFLNIFGRNEVYLEFDVESCDVYYVLLAVFSWLVSCIFEDNRTFPLLVKQWRFYLQTN